VLVEGSFVRKGVKLLGKRGILIPKTKLKTDVSPMGGDGKRSVMFKQKNVGKNLTDGIKCEKVSDPLQEFRFKSGQERRGLKEEVVSIVKKKRCPEQETNYGGGSGRAKSRGG